MRLMRLRHCGWPCLPARWVSCFSCVYRFGRVAWLSILDAVMGATSAAAVTTALDGTTELALAVGGVAAGLALSRWQPSRGMLLIGAGVIAPRRRGGRGAGRGAAAGDRRLAE